MPSSPASAVAEAPATAKADPDAVEDGIAIEAGLAAREEARDWRLLFLDAYAPHMTDEVALAAWERGYIVVYHGGVSTGTCQVNDPDCHAELERLYLECEALTMMDQLLVDPGNIGRSRQQARGVDPSDGLSAQRPAFSSAFVGWLSFS